MSDVKDYKYSTLSTIVGSDINVPISIDSQSVKVAITIDATDVTGNIPIDISAQSVGNIAIDIAASSIGNVPIDIKAQSITGGVPIDIETQSVTNLSVDIAAQSLGTVDIAIDAADVTGDIPIDISAQSVGNVGIDIAAQSVGNVGVNLAAQDIDIKITNEIDPNTGNRIPLDIDIAAQSVGNVDVDIAAQSVGNIAIDVAAQSVGDIAVDLSSQSLSNVSIDVAAQSIGNIDVNLAAQGVALDVSAAEVDVNINTQTVDLDVKQGEMTGREMKWDPTSATDGFVTSTGYGWYLSNQTFGKLGWVKLRMRSTDGASASVTLSFAPLPGMGEQRSLTFSTSSTTETVVANWHTFTGDFTKYNTLCVWISSIDANAEVAYQSGMGGKGSITGVPDNVDYTADGIRVVIDFFGVGKALPVAGTVNNIQLPNQSGKFDSGDTLVAAGTTETLVDILGTGTIQALVIEVNHDKMVPKAFADGSECVWSLSPLDWNGYDMGNTTQPYVLLTYNAGGTCRILYTRKIDFQREFKVTVNNPTTSDYYAHVYIDYKIIG